jgi:cytochrome c peroxidase
MNKARAWRSACSAAALAFAAALALTDAAADGGKLLDFTDAERHAILSHGPWPPPLAPDPSNRVSGNREAAALGQRLFFDGRLSANGRVACVSCHAPPAMFADRRKTSLGLVAVERNAPSLVNTRFSRWFGWDGGSDSLWAHSIRPLTDPREHGITLERLVGLLASDPELSCRYTKVFGRGADSVSVETASADAGKAMAAFQETLISISTKFDAFRDALARGDHDGAARYPENAQRGLRIFVGKGNCSICHVGPLFSNREFADTGIPFFLAPGKVDPGRYGGIVRVRQDVFNQLGRYNDDPAHAPGTATRHVDLQQKNFGEWKVPGLRNVAQTAPYMHNGSLATLHDVVKHYSELDEERLHADGEKILRPLRLNEDEVGDLIAFLETLTSPPPGLMMELLPTARAREPCVAAPAK